MLKAASPNSNGVTPLDSRDIRFTCNKANTVIYAFVLGWPGNEAAIQALGAASPQNPGKVEHVELLGSPHKVSFKQDASALRIQLPAQKTSNYAIALKISLA